MKPDDQLSDTPQPEKREWFPTTHWSVVSAAGASASPQAAGALEKLCVAYWYPLYAFVRRRGHSPHDAEDLVQEFFARLLEKNYVGSADRERGKFRTFLLTSLKHFLSKERDKANAVKRGGGKIPISLDEDTAEGLYRLEPVSNASPESLYERRWAALTLERAFARLQQDHINAGKAKFFEHLKGFLADDSDQGSYAATAERLDMTTSAVAVAVHRLRQRYRQTLRDEIANTVTNPNEIDGELLYLLTVLTQ